MCVEKGEKLKKSMENGFKQVLHIQTKKCAMPCSDRCFSLKLSERTCLGKVRLTRTLFVVASGSVMSGGVAGFLELLALML